MMSRYGHQIIVQKGFLVLVPVKRERATGGKLSHELHLVAHIGGTEELGSIGTLQLGINTTGGRTNDNDIASIQRTLSDRLFQGARKVTDVETTVQKILHEKVPAHMLKGGYFKILGRLVGGPAAYISALEGNKANFVLATAERRIGRMSASVTESDKQEILRAYRGVDNVIYARTKRQAASAILEARKNGRTAVIIAPFLVFKFLNLAKPPLTSVDPDDAGYIPTTMVGAGKKKPLPAVARFLGRKSRGRPKPITWVAVYPTRSKGGKIEYKIADDISVVATNEKSALEKVKKLIRNKMVSIGTIQDLISGGLIVIPKQAIPGLKGGNLPLDEIVRIARESIISERVALTPQQRQQYVRQAQMRQYRQTQQPYNQHDRDSELNIPYQPDLDDKVARAIDAGGKPMTTVSMVGMATELGSAGAKLAGKGIKTVAPKVIKTTARAEKVASTGAKVAKTAGTVGKAASRVGSKLIWPLQAVTTVASYKSGKEQAYKEAMAEYLRRRREALQAGVAV